MYSAKDLYDFKEFTITWELYPLINHVDESSLSDYNCYDIPVENNTRIEIRVIKDFSYDGRRCWRLHTVWFDGQPVMVIQNAGKEGVDYVNRCITNGVLFLSMCNYINGLLQLDPQTVVIEDANDKTLDLGNFYGQDLDGYFKRY
jgi:hypothetical protein